MTSILSKPNVGGVRAVPHVKRHMTKTRTQCSHMGANIEILPDCLIRTRMNAISIYMRERRAGDAARTRSRQCIRRRAHRGPRRIDIIDHYGLSAPKVIAARKPPLHVARATPSRKGALIAGPIQAQGAYAWQSQVPGHRPAHVEPMVEPAARSSLWRSRNRHHAWSAVQPRGRYGAGDAMGNAI